MLKINRLKVAIEDNEKNTVKQILHGVNLELPYGEVHAIMGPNGSGKSTLANVLAGRNIYKFIDGEIIYQGENLLSHSPEIRAQNGLFLAFQYPCEIPGVNNAYFLRAALNALRKSRGQTLLDAGDFLNIVREKLAVVGLDQSFLQRAVNEGFSGGEKKRNEILQMLLFEPKLIILDETDSGLDIDALQMVGCCVNQLRDAKRSILIITHYHRLLEHVQPDIVHVMAGGKIKTSGKLGLALELEKNGYSWLEGLPQ